MNKPALKSSTPISLLRQFHKLIPPPNPAIEVIADRLRAYQGSIHLGQHHEVSIDAAGAELDLQHVRRDVVADGLDHRRRDFAAVHGEGKISRSAAARSLLTCSPPRRSTRPKMRGPSLRCP